MTDNATAAFTAGAITAEAYREHLGLDADSGHILISVPTWLINIGAGVAGVMFAWAVWTLLFRRR